MEENFDNPTEKFLKVTVMQAKVLCSYYSQVN